MRKEYLYDGIMDGWIRDFDVMNGCSAHAILAFWIRRDSFRSKLDLLDLLLLILS